MTKYILKTFTLLLFVALTNKAFSQEFIIKDYKELPTDVAARTYEVSDVNGDACALIKISTGIKNLKFDGNRGVEKVDYDRRGEVWVWVPPTTRQLKISKDGIPMKAYEFSSGLKSYSVYSLTVITTQSLNITINTPGVTAEIKINNKTFKSNLPIPDLEEGKYPIQISRIGYYTLVDTINVNFSSTFFSYDLKRTKKERLTINTVPENCELFLNDTLIGPTNHSASYHADEYRILLKKKNYLTIDTVIIFNPNLQSVYNFKLEKNTGTLKLTTEPETSIIFIDNEPVNNKTIELEARVNHVLRVESSHYVTYTETFSLKKNTTIEKNIKLDKQTGKILIVINPNGSKIELTHENGEYYKWKGNKTVPLPEGKYDLKISKKGYNTKETSIVIKDKQTNRYTSELSIAGADRGRAGTYSALVPGWGQFHSHRKIAGATFMAAAAGLAATTLYYNAKANKLDETYEIYQSQYNSAHEATDVEELGNKMKDAYDEYDVMATKRDQVANIFLAVYFVNIIDAVVFAKFYSPNKRHKMKIGYIPVKNGGALALSYKF